MSRLTAALAVLVLFLPACGDDEDAAERPVDAGTTTTVEQDSSTTRAAAGGGGDEAAAVAIVDFGFDPPTIEVASGSTVTWANEDGVTHTVTAGAPGDVDGTFDESLDGGDSAEISFDEAGTFPYFCSLHPTMTAEVVVS